MSTLLDLRPGMDPRTQHGIATVIQALEANPNGALGIDALYRC